ncbi:DEBR0S5_07074g1_1 [Brettanomyces bruxellensis]|uniref:DEBR0S5_07074g1_1 n=1 Tax=Dekkera bruxellensis TaxID=5007 RepID=A0A7D9H402_DEKBR|nr:DEBR0S5_07074g1_1 [Brettanomyces bruxellensis]
MDKPTSTRRSGKQYAEVSPLEYLEFSSKLQWTSGARSGSSRQRKVDGESALGISSGMRSRANSSNTNLNYTPTLTVGSKNRNCSRQSLASITSTETTSTVGSLLSKLRLNENGDEEGSGRISSPILEDDELTAETESVFSENGSRESKGSRKSKGIYLRSDGRSTACESVPAGAIAIPASRFRSLRPVFESLKKKELEDSAARSAMAMGNKIGTVENELPIYNSAEDVQSIHVHPFRLSESSMDSISTAGGSSRSSYVDSVTNNAADVESTDSCYSSSTDRNWRHSYRSVEVMNGNVDSRDDIETIDGSRFDSETPKVSPRKSKAVSISMKKAAGVHVVKTDVLQHPSVTPHQKPRKMYVHVHSFSNPVDTTAVRKSCDSMQSITPLSKTFHHRFYHATAPSPVTNEESPDSNWGMPLGRHPVYSATERPEIYPAPPMMRTPSRSRSFSSGDAEFRARTVLKNAKRQREIVQYCEQPGPEPLPGTGSPTGMNFDTLSALPTHSKPVLVEHMPASMRRISLEVQEPAVCSRNSNRDVCPSSPRPEVPLPRQVSLKKLRGEKGNEGKGNEGKGNEGNENKGNENEGKGNEGNENQQKVNQEADYKHHRHHHRHHTHAYRELVKASTTQCSMQTMASSNSTKSTPNPLRASCDITQSTITTRKSSTSSSSSSAKRVLRNNTSSSGPSTESASLPSSTSVSSASPLEPAPQKLAPISIPSSPPLRAHTHARIRSTSSFTTKPLPPQQESPIWKIRDSLHLDTGCFPRGQVGNSVGVPGSARSSISGSFSANSPHTPSALQTSFSADTRDTGARSGSFQQPASALTAESRVSMAIALRKSGNSGEATHQLRIAASQGNIEAMFLYGLSLRYGYGVPIQERESFLWICDSANITPDSSYNFDVSPKRILKQLAQPGSALTPQEPQTSVYFEIGQAYLHGWGCAVSRRQALQFFELSGSLGYTDAMCEAGKMWTSKKLNGERRDLARAATWFRLAEKCGAELLGSRWFHKKRYD